MFACIQRLLARWRAAPELPEEDPRPIPERTEVVFDPETPEDEADSVIEAQEASMRQAIPDRPLKLFRAADTSSEVIERLPMGRFDVLEEHEDAFGVLWVKLRSPVSREVGWMVVSDGHADYAALVDPDQRLQESLLVKNILDYLGWVYIRTGAHYPNPIPGVPGIPIAPPNDSNCNTFTESVIIDAAIEGGQLEVMLRALHDLWMIIELPRDKPGPPKAAAELGLGIALKNVDALPPSWSLGQGWSSGGHSFIVLASDRVTNKVLMIESNLLSKYKLNGPGYRYLGDIETFPAPGHHPGPGWTQLSVASWDEIRRVYPELYLTALFVDDDTWARTGKLRG